MKISLDIRDDLFIKIELMSKLSGLSVQSILKEAVWREANRVKPLIAEFVEKGYLDNEEKNAVDLLRYPAPIRPESIKTT